MKKLKEKYSHHLYKLGLGMSFLCAIHCLSMPFLLVLLPTVGEHLFPAYIENAIIVSSLAIAVYLLSRDYKLHRNSLPFALLISSSVFYFLNILAHNHLYSIIGSILMASAYVLNWVMHRKVCKTPF
ncbi:MerC domain-containing protein [Jiulongibacter sp. NS-SX5]|uniref:MerC domain-containing protein n=1 Tax=Jiulongibacter sp. NS-SX5 TaxID=3463854 RepID=UPI0040592DC3